MKTYYSNSVEETESLGRAIAEKLFPGAFIALFGDLGAGKTAFCRGVGEALGVHDVMSPTFTIVQVYEEGRLPFYHFDVYRIGDVSEMDEIGYEDMFFGEGLCLVEWANLIEEILPDTYKRVTIEKDLSKGFDYRRITLELIEG